MPKLDLNALADRLSATVTSMPKNTSGYIKRELVEIAYSLRCEHARQMQEKGE